MVSAETDQNLRGLTITHLVIDEAAYIKESLWTEVLKPACMIRGKKVLFVSTPRAKNWFHKAFEWGQDEAFPDWSAYRITTEENPFIPKEEIEQARKTLPQNTFLSEYLGIFLDDAGSVFAGYGKCCVLDQFPVQRKDGEKYYAGLDLALANDYSVLVIFDSKGNMVDMFRENKTSWEQIIDKVSEKIKFWNCETLVELNSIGSVVYEILKKRHGSKITSITTGSNKSDLIESLKNSLASGFLKLPQEDLFPELHTELSIFTYKVLPSGKLSYSAPGGMHDDIVMSMAFANKQLVHKANRPIVAFPSIR
jgi:phage FluMu gp28-like protein